MTKDEIVKVIHSGVSSGSFTYANMLVLVNELLEKEIVNTLKESNGKISFTEDYPRLTSCCFSQVQELDVREIRFENELVFICEDPETHDIYELNSEDFLMGELRHVVDKIEK